MIISHWLIDIIDRVFHTCDVLKTEHFNCVGLEWQQQF